LDNEGGSVGTSVGQTITERRVAVTILSAIADRLGL
jgi:hypothetical protein